MFGFGQTVHADMPVIARAVVQPIEGDLGMDLAAARLGEHQPDGGPVPADQAPGCS